MKKVLPLLFLSSSAFLLNLPSVFACAVCFGGADSNLVRGFTWGVSILLVLPFALVAGLVAMVALNVKKNKTTSFPNQSDHPHA